jgi:hypothetical protein
MPQTDMICLECGILSSVELPDGPFVVLSGYCGACGPRARRQAVEGMCGARGHPEYVGGGCRCGVKPRPADAQEAASNA